MGLVDYDSDSASEVEPATDPEPTPKPSSQASSKKPFQKVVHRSNPGKVFVSLPTQASSTNNSNSNSNSNGDEPPAKRARTTGGGLFSGFNSFLPAPKNTGKQAIKPSTSNTTRPGVKLKTSAAPGFSRDVDEDDTMQQFAAPTSISDLPSGGLSLPPPKRQESAPSIPEGQTPAEEVKLVGKQPLMFRPLSVAMNAKKKKNKNKPGPASTTQPPASNATPALSTPAVPSEPAPETKVSLFFMHTEEPSDPVPTTSSANNGAYEPLFETAYEADPASAGSSVPVEKQYDTLLPTNAAGASESLDNMADDLNLSAAARRELFGRDGSNFAAKKVVNFNMDREYRHNEDVRASGDQQTHNPVRALQSGKHSLKQLVQNVQNQKDALEDSFAKGRSNRKEASSRYGW